MMNIQAEYLKSGSTLTNITIQYKNRAGLMDPADYEFKDYCSIYQEKDVLLTG